MSDVASQVESTKNFNSLFYFFKKMHKKECEKEEAIGLVKYLAQRGILFKGEEELLLRVIGDEK